MKICDLRSALTTRWLALLVGWVLAVPLAQSASAPADSPAFPLDTRLTEITASATYSSGGGIYGDTATITITSNLANGAIYYSTDGTTPSIGGSLTYSGTFTISATKTIRALAVNLDTFETKAGEPLTVTIVPTYALALTTAGGGTVVATPAASRYLSGTVVSITATPATGWTWMNWTGGDVTGAAVTAATASVTMSGPRTAAAVFGTTLTSSVTGGGAVAVSPAVGPYAYGSVVRLVPKPNEGSAFSLWGSASSGSANPLDFTVTQPGKTISALFANLGSSQVNLYWDVTGSGAVSVSPQKNVYAVNDTVTVTPVPGTNQVFTGWSGALSGMQNPATVTLATSKSITANFQAGVVVAAASPARNVVNAGGALTLAATVTGAPVPTLQWMRNGRAIPGATDAAYGITNAESKIHTGWYQLRAANQYGIVASSAMHVIVSGPTQVVAWGQNDQGQTSVPAGLVNVVAVSRTWSGSLALRADGTVVAWGAAPKPPDGLTEVVALAGGWSHALALKADGKVVAWGSVTSVPSGTEDIVSIAAGGNSQCLALRRDGRVLSWGAMPALPSEIVDVVGIAAGDRQVAVVKTDGTVLAWGSTAQTSIPAAATGVVQIACSADNIMALTAAGTVVVWGENLRADPPSDMGVAVKIAAGGYHYLALKTDGSLVQWVAPDWNLQSVATGLNRVVGVAAGRDHSLALRDASADLAPTIVMQPIAAVTAAAGQMVRLAVSAAAGAAPIAYQWRKGGVAINGATGATLSISVDSTGAGSYEVVVSNYLGSVTSAAAALTLSSTARVSDLQGGRLVVNQGSPLEIAAAASFVPAGASVQWKRNGRPIPGATNVTLSLANVSAATDGGRYSLEVNSGGTVVKSAVLHVAVSLPGRLVSWGKWQSGVPSVPADLPPLVGFTAGLNEGYLFGLGLKSDGSVVSIPWGDTGGGQNSVPANLNNVVQLAAGGLHGVALRADGTVVAWGYNSRGQVSKVNGLGGVMAVAAAAEDTLVLKSDGTVAAWGLLSDSIPVPGSLSGVVDVVGGMEHYLALKADSTAVAWGNGGHGRTAVPNDLTGVISVAAGWNHSLALKSDGTVVAWGLNDHGQSTPPAGLTGVVAISAGGWHSMALKADGSVVAWGSKLNLQTSVPAGLSKVFSISSSGNHSFALRDSSGDLAPTITTPPASQTVDEGTPVTFAVTFNSGTAPVTYQWRKGTVAIGGATNATLALAEALSPDAGSYDVVVTNYLGTATSQAATLTVNPSPPPSVTVPPQNIAVMAGESANFTVSSAGSLPRYQWLRNGSAISGATSATLALSAVTLADAGTYTVQLSNRAGSVTSVGAALTVSAAPLISTQPAAQTVVAGGTATLSAGATGYPALSYQWKFNGASLAGATNASLTLNPVRGADAGSYSVVISNALGVVTSNSATLVVNVPPSITTQPVSLASIPGSGATFTVVAAGAPTPSYQWYKGADLIAGAAGASYVISQVSTNDAGQYKVVVTNPVGTAESNVVSLTVNIPPVIGTQPATAKSVSAGTAVDFIVVATGTPAPSFQWRKDGVAINGATSSIYTIAAAGAVDAGTYTVVVTNAGGFITSNSSVLTVSSFPVITQQPLARAVTQGAAATFSVAAVGSAPLTYEWRKDGVVIPGATGTSYTVASVQTSDASSYMVIVQNSLGSVSSNAAVLTVAVPVTITTAPANVTVAAGSPASFTVVVSGTAPFTYQWKKDGVGIAGASLATLTLPAPSLADAGSYAVTVANAVSDVSSGGALLTVTAPPAITTQPQALTVVAGAGASLTVVATGGPAPTYQWKKNGSPVAGATLATLTFAAAQAADAAAYTVEVVNSQGAVTSTAAALTVILPPVITRQPAAQTANVGGSVVLVVAATGNAALTYQWRRGGTAISGATTATYRFLARASGDAGSYDVVIKAGGVAITTSTAVAFAVNDAPLFGPGLTGAYEIGAGEGITLAAASPLAAQSWRWYRNGQPIAGAAASTLVLTNVSRADAGWYQLQTTSATGAVSLSAAVFLQVRIPNQVIAFGANAAGQAAVPTAVSDALAVSAGYNHTLAIRSGGNVVGWGSNLYSQLSLPTKLGRSVQVAAGVAHSVALQSDGTVVAWGTGGATGSGVATVPTSLANVVAIAAGRVHTLALKSDGTVVGWGAPSFGQELPPVGLRDVVAIAAGSEHSLALRADGTVVAWGNSNDGRIALPAGLANIVAVATGAEHSLALRADGRVIAWGKADSGRTIVPADLTNVIAIAGGIAHSVALRADGTLVAWGAADQGQAAVPLGLGSVYELSAAGGFHTAVLRDKRNDAVPVILTSPENRTVAEGASLRLAATGDFGTAPLNVQWTRNGTAIPGASLSTYIVPEVTGAVAGTYQVSVSNYLGTATSGSAVVQVTVVVGGTPASIVVPPVSVSVLSGRATTLMVEAAGTPPLSYVWKRNGLTVTGATTSRLDLANVTADAAYTVAVSNSITTVESAPAQISVFTAQALLSAATSGYVEGTLVTLQTSLTFGGSLAGLGLQLALPAGWTFVSADDQAPVRPGAGAGGTLGWAWTTVPASPVMFSVVLRASADSVGPRAVAGFAILRAGGGAYDVPFPALELPQVSKPRVVLQPASGLLALSGNAALTVGVSGAAPFTYVWTRNGQTLVDGGRISGAGTSMLTLTGATTVDAGSYQVTVSNSAGTVTSQAATLAVVDATASHALVGSGYIAGGAVTVTNTLTYSGTAGSLGWQVLLPPGWTYVAGSGSEGDIKPFAGTTDLLEWAWVTIPASPLQFTYTLRAPLDSAGDQTLAALVVFRQFGVLQQFLAKPDPLVLTKMVAHSADTNRDGKISLLELTRVIELYNTRIGTVRTGCYKVDLAGEDGFSPDPERLKSAVVALAGYHSADPDFTGQLDLKSLTRVIQLYNYRSGSVRTGQYRVQSGTEDTEDGFAPGPP
jgi:alpha-tubulin suppressor-like RCC1 family protein